MENNISKKINKKTLDLIKLIQDTKPRNVSLSSFLSDNKHELCIQEGVFPFDLISYSSKVMSEIIPKNPEKVLDIGTGTGIQAIVAASKGAKSVLAIDIDEKAIENTQYNIQKLGLIEKISTKKSDLFRNITKTKFDTIIAQLPFSDLEYECELSHMLFDPNYTLHERLLAEVENYLETTGKLLLTNGDLGNKNKLNHLLEKYGFKITQTKINIHNGLSWEAYIIKKEDA